MTAPSSTNEPVGLRRSLEILHALQTLGLMKQIVDPYGNVVWRVACSKQKFDAVMTALRS